MRKVPLAGAVAALVLGVAGAVAVSAASQAAEPAAAKSKTLVFDVVFSPFEFVQANNVHDTHSLAGRRARRRSSPTASASVTTRSPA